MKMLLEKRSNFPKILDNLNKKYKSILVTVHRRENWGENLLNIAKGIKKPKAVRAVANAIGKNPYAPKIPCHRVIRSDGSLGGYSGKGGIKTKKKLLKSEGILL